MKAKAVINVPLYHEHSNDGTLKDEPLEENQGILDVISERLKFCSVNVQLLAPYTRHTTPPPINPKILNSVRNLKSIYVRFITQHAAQWQADLCDQIILNSSPTLEELRLHWEGNFNFASLSGTVFPKLKKTGATIWLGSEK